jgi:hypothetical protein
MARSRSRRRVLAFFCVLIPLGAAGARGQAPKPAVVTGLADEAMRFLDSGDGRHKVRLLRRGRFSLEATAKDAPSAVSLAKLALERFDR